jgi:hypothetical protein
MVESELNLLIKMSLIALGEKATKISDPIKGTGVQNPFDGFGGYKRRPFYWEAKLIKPCIKAFNFKIIYDHQYENIAWYHNNIYNSLSLFLIGFYSPRKLKIIMAFDPMFILEERGKGKVSFLAKELNAWYSKGLFCDTSMAEVEGKRRCIFDFKDLDRKVINGYE